ncbi:MAG: FAD binding domain-containing protein [Chloroflexi bacterium]|nr:FAD binding domain-containing protein [Chloroflexota bacterium]
MAMLEGERAAVTASAEAVARPQLDPRTIEAWLEQDEPVAGTISTDYLPRFTYLRPTTLAEAVAVLERHGPKAALMSGGMDLLRELKTRSRPAQPEVVVSLKGIAPPLDYVCAGESGLAIGSLATLRTLETSALVREQYGILAQAAYASRAWQYRNRATIGGDLCQRELCWYSRSSGNAYPCFRKGGEDCFATRGDNRFHAIFGRLICSAVCPSATAPSLAALGARVRIVGPSGGRSVPVEAFFTPRGTVLGSAEIVAEVQVPSPAPGARGVFLKVGVRNKFDPALASVAVLACIEQQVCRTIRIVLGGVSPQPWRAFRAEELLIGERLTESSVARAAEAVVEGATPLSHNGYKIDLARSLVGRALVRLAE